MGTLLQICGLSIGHKGTSLYDGLSFEVREGDCIMLCGANGSGKTTLLKALSQMKTVSGREVVMIPTRIPKVKGFTLREFVSLSASCDCSAVDSSIDRLGLSSLASRDISTLSDGEFQKAAIASALVKKASVMLLAEPTAFLDVENRVSVLKLLRNLCEEESGGVLPAVIFSTHDVYDGLRCATRMISLHPEGRFSVSESPSEKDIHNLFPTL